MNQQEQELWNGLIAKYNADEKIARMKLTNYGGMYYSVLAHNHWKTPATTREDKVRDMMKTDLPEQLAVVEYVVRHDFPQLIYALEK